MAESLHHVQAVQCDKFQMRWFLTEVCEMPDDLDIGNVVEL